MGGEVLAPPRPSQNAYDFSEGGRIGLPFGAGSDVEAQYEILRWNTREIPDGFFDPVNSRVYQKQFPISGDHFYVDQIQGQRPLYARFNTDETYNPRIRLEQGVVYRRRFTQVTIETGWWYGIAPAPTFLTAYISNGPLIEKRQPWPLGFRQPYIYASTATTIYGIVVNNPSGSSYHFTLGKRGGFVVIKNLSLVQTLQVSWEAVDAAGNGPAVSALGTPGANTGGGYPIWPRSEMVWPMNGPIVTDNMALCVGCFAAGGCPYVAILSSGEIDHFDSEQVINLGLNV